LNGMTLKLTWFFCWCRNQFSISKSPKQHHDMTQILSNGKQYNITIDLIIEVLCEIISVTFKNKYTFVAHYFRDIRINISPTIPHRILMFSGERRIYLMDIFLFALHCDASKFWIQLFHFFPYSLFLSFHLIPSNNKIKKLTLKGFKAGLSIAK